MNRILITGKKGYIGTSLKKWLERQREAYSVDMLDMRNDDWIDHDFSNYDSVVHAAAVVHKDEKKYFSLYEQVNHELTVELYKKCQDALVPYFVFLSTAGVYKERDSLFRDVIINENSPLEPYTEYGRTKYRAELDIQELYKKTHRTKIAIVRPPFVYGPDCKGNYVRLSKFAKKAILIPDIENRRSMIYIDNLCEFLKCLIEERRKGIFLPQNQEYVCVTDMMEKIARVHGKRVYKTKIFNPLIKILSRKLDVFNKIYGNNIYELRLSGFLEIGNYCKVSYEESIRKTECNLKGKSRENISDRS